MTEKDFFLQKLLQKKEERDYKAKQIIEAGKTQHSHAEMADWLKCFQCALAKREQDRVRKVIGLDGNRRVKFERRRVATNRLIQTVQNLRYGVKLHL